MSKTNVENDSEVRGRRCVEGSAPRPPSEPVPRTAAVRPHFTCAVQWGRDVTHAHQNSDRWPTQGDSVTTAAAGAPRPRCPEHSARRGVHRGSPRTGWGGGDQSLDESAASSAPEADAGVDAVAVNENGLKRYIYCLAMGDGSSASHVPQEPCGERPVWCRFSPSGASVPPTPRACLCGRHAACTHASGARVFVSMFRSCSACPRLLSSAKRLWRHGRDCPGLSGPCRPTVPELCVWCVCKQGKSDMPCNS